MQWSPRTRSLRRVAFVELALSVALVGVAAPAGARLVRDVAVSPPSPQGNDGGEKAGPGNDHEQRDGAGDEPGKRDGNREKPGKRDGAGDKPDKRNGEANKPRDDQRAAGQAGDYPGDGRAHDDKARIDAATPAAATQPRVRSGRGPESYDRRTATTAAAHDAAPVGSTAATTSPPTSTTVRQAPTPQPPAPATPRDQARAMSVHGVTAIARPQPARTLDGELVSRRYASPTTAVFVALAILALLLVGGRRRTRGLP
jgi:hypothetical protein